LIVDGVGETIVALAQIYELAASVKEGTAAEILVVYADRFPRVVDAECLAQAAGIDIHERCLARGQVPHGVTALSSGMGVI
jgi:hypothetical protein